MKHVRIYGTLGPACADRETLGEMFRAGMDGLRLNLSHSGLEASAGLIEAFRGAAADCGKRPELLIDMQGPELRVGTLAAPIPLGVGEALAPEAIPFPKEVREALAGAAPGIREHGKLGAAFHDDRRLFRLASEQLLFQPVHLLLHERKFFLYRGIFSG